MDDAGDALRKMDWRIFSLNVIPTGSTTGASFTIQSGTSGGNSLLQVDPGAHFTAHNSTFAWSNTVLNSTLNTGDVTGNLLTWHNKVYDTSDTTQVGTDQGSCVRISPADGSWECAWTTFLSKGQITVEGPYYDTKNSVLAITGGTGRYSGARGQMELLARDGGTEYDFVFHLI